MRCFFLICLTAWVSDLYGQMIFNVKEYGATGSGTAFDTHAISKAIDKCKGVGGGVIYFPPGVYLTGSFELFSDMTLHFESGATLLASPNLSDYASLGLTSEYRSTSLIYAKGASNIAITGKGIIDGNDKAFFDFDSLGAEWFVNYDVVRQGKSFKTRFPDGPLFAGKRPGILIALLNCNNVLLRDIKVINAPNWCIHLACCKDVDVTHIDVVNSLLVPNADGIDISQSQRVNISNCTFTTGDDGIAISPCADGFCTGEARDITVSNCVITSRSAAIRLGWASKSTISNCVFQNLVLHSNRGICINARYGETIENIQFANVIINTRLHSGWWGKGEPIHISQIPDRQEGGVKHDYEKAVIRNISFSNLMITSEAGVLVYAFHKNAIRDIYFDAVMMKMKNGEFNSISGGNFDLRPAFDDKYSVFAHDIPAFYFKGTKNVRINNLTLEWLDKMPSYYTHAIFAEVFSGLKLTNVDITSAPGTHLPAVHLKDGEKAGIEIDGINNKGFVKMEGIQ